MEYDYWKPGALEKGRREEFFRDPKKFRDGTWTGTGEMRGPGAGTRSGADAGVEGK